MVGGGVCLHRKMLSRDGKIAGTKGDENLMLGSRDPGEGGYAGFRALYQIYVTFSEFEIKLLYSTS